MNKDEERQRNQSDGWSRAEVEAMLPAFALRALEADELLAVETYLRGDAAMRARADELTASMHGLAYSVPSVAPPPELSAQILARVGAQTPPLTAPASAASKLTRPTAVSATHFRNRSGLGRRIGIWWRANAASAAIGVAAAALLLFTGLYMVQLQGRIGDLEDQLSAGVQELAALQAEMVQIEEVNALLQEQIRGQNAQLASLTSADLVLALAGTEDAPNAGGLFSLTADQATLVASNLPPIGEDQTYELWLIPDGGAPAPAGLLSAQSGERAIWTITVPLRSGEFALVGLSIEPAGGSPAPTGPIVLLGG
ncbi:MAG: anti-sigma factor [Caldilineaceae bacterium]|nr:anti-sigma factor [Caldilineaceae bacterium]